MTKEEVLNLMSSSKNEQEWNTNCDKVKKEFNGYPSWWYVEVVLSKLADKTFGEGSSDIKIIAL